MAESFLQIIHAWDESAANHIRKLIEWYPPLLGFGWTHTEVEMALELGYNFENHVVDSKCRWAWKYGRNAGPFYRWVKHAYRQLKAEELGMSLEEFIALWRGFVTRGPRIRYWDDCGRRINARATLAYYLRARRRGLEDQEIRRALFLFREPEYFNLYVKLRKKFDNRFVLDLLSASRQNDGQLDEKYVVEAIRLGASHDEVLQSVRTNSLHKLATSLRQAHRTPYE